MSLRQWLVTEYPALGSRWYTLMLLAVSVRHLGNWAVYLAETWFMYRIQPTPLVLGLVTAAAMGPYLILPAVGGQLADRYGPVVVAYGCRLVTGAALLAYAGLYFAGVVHVPTYLALALAIGASRAMEAPAGSLFARAVLTDKHQLPSAMALSTVSYDVARLLGPAVAGLLILSLNEGWVFVIGALCLLPELPLMRRLPRRAEDKTGARALDWRGALEVLNTPHIRVVAACMAIGSFALTPFTTQLTAYAVEVLKRDVGLATLLASAIAPSAMLVSLLSARIVRRFGDLRVMTAAMAGAAGLLLALSAVPSVPTAVVVVSVLGALQVLVALTSQSTLQVTLGLHIKGQTAGLMTILSTGVAVLGTLTAAALATLLGVPAYFLFSALFLLALGGLAVYRAHQHQNSHTSSKEPPHVL